MRVNRDRDVFLLFARARLRLRCALPSRQQACLAAPAFPVRPANPTATAIYPATAPRVRILTIRRVLRLIFPPAMLANSPSKPSARNPVPAKQTKSAAILPVSTPFPVRTDRF